MFSLWTCFFSLIIMISWWKSSKHYIMWIRSLKLGGECQKNLVDTGRRAIHPAWSMKGELLEDRWRSLKNFWRSSNGGRRGTSIRKEWGNGRETFWKKWGFYWLSKTPHPLTCHLESGQPYWLAICHIVLWTLYRPRFLSPCNMMACSCSPSVQPRIEAIPYDNAIWVVLCGAFT